ncbi:MAG: phenylalanine--tRNA ligase subunit beta [Pseudohongiellaceae bacterium]
MKFSYQWLKQLVDHGLSVPDLTERLTMAGLEVAATTPVATHCEGVVVGEVKTVAPHPDANKLSLCEVYDGKTTVPVVCGAPNVRAGMRAPFARVNAKLEQPADTNPEAASQDRLHSANSEKKLITIHAAKIRGVKSQGMLCSAEELGLEDKSAGILELDADAKPGEDIRTTLMLDDVSISLDLTPNRGDCLGMIGLAREVGVLTRTTPHYPTVPKVQENTQEQFPITISATAACPRYLGRVIKNVNLQANTPLWLQERLRRGGLRSIDPIVDVTNYILLEYGQPLHAFDLDKLQGGINVRMAKPDERIKLLDGKELNLHHDTLVIADAKQAVAIAGIMGGQHTAVSKNTRNILLECAFFSPLAISGKARHYGLQTDASHRYERGVDFAIQQQALAAATQLLQNLAGGDAGPVVEATGELPNQTEVSLKLNNVERLLGVTLPEKEVIDVLTRLGFKVETEKSGIQYKVSVPSFRFDVSIEADLIEELARIHGYNRLPGSHGTLPQQLGMAPETQTSDARLKRQLAALGYQEVISYSFIDPTWSQLVFHDTESEVVALENPLSAEMSVMRTSLLPGLLQILAYNSNRQQERLRIFELGMVFQWQNQQAATQQKSKTSPQTRGSQLENIKQHTRIAGLISGSRLPRNWSHRNESPDFYDIKGDIESLLGTGQRAKLAFQPADPMPFHGGQCAAILLGGEADAGKGKGKTSKTGKANKTGKVGKTGKEADKIIGYIGALHPAVQRQIEVPAPVFLFELDLEAIRAVNLPRANDLSRYPEVSRDLALVLNEDIPAGEVLQEVRANGGEHLQQVRMFDVYQGEGVAKGKKSLALGLIWRHPLRTLDDKEINAIIDDCINALQRKFDADLRK